MKSSDVTDKLIEETGRYIVCMALKGSRNYELHTETSDYDFMGFYLPTMRELYRGDMNGSKEFKGTINGEEYEGIMYDVRRLPTLTKQANPAFLEFYYSLDVDVRYMPGGLARYLDEEQIKFKLTHANMTGFYHSSLGVVDYEINHMYRGSAELVEKYGYNTKKAMHARRFLDILVYMSDPKMTFGEALRPNDKSHEYLKEIREGKFTKKHIDDELFSLICRAHMFLKDKYISRPTNLEEINRLDDMIYEYLFNNEVLNDELKKYPLYKRE